MRNFSKPIVFGLLWLTFAAAAFGATSSGAIRPMPESSIFLLAGALLFLVGLMPRRRKS
jgi:hypothetical protein